MSMPPSDPNIPDPTDPAFRGPDVPTPPVSSQPGGGYGAPQPGGYGTPQPQPGAPTAPMPPASVPPGQAPTGYSQMPPAGYQNQLPESAKTDGVSIAALITGIMFLSIVPIVLGILGIRRTGEGKAKGRGMAIAGLILGVVSTLFWIGFLGLVVFAVNQVGNTVGSTYESSCRQSNMASCDLLGEMNGISSEQRKLADTCNNTQPAGSLGKCLDLQLDADSLPSSDSGTSPSADALGDDSLGDDDGEDTASLQQEITKQLAAGGVTSIDPDTLRKYYDAMMPEATKKLMKNDAQRKAGIAQVLSQCENGTMSVCDAVGYMADKKKDAEAWKVADTCGGKYPEGGYLLKCQFAAMAN